MSRTSTPTGSRLDEDFGAPSPLYRFGEIQHQLDSMEGQDEDDAYWNTSGQGGFNFEEDGPTMYVSSRPIPERPKILHFKPKLEKEVAQFASTSSGRGNTPKQTAEAIFLGKPYSLEQFRSREQKVELLEAALSIGDTSAIQVVVLFLRNTLKASLFQQEIIQRPLALKALVSYLRDSGENAGVIEQLSLSGRSDEAARHRYSVISQIEDNKAKTRALETSINTHFLGCREQALLADELKLLKLQAKIQECDAITIEQVNETILGSSLVDTVRYCAKYHAKDPETHFASPVYLKQEFKLSPEQYSYACISGFAETQNYEAIESFLESKSWLGKKKLSSSIGFDKIVVILHQHKAPVDLLEKYITYVDDVEDRMELAKKVGAMTSLVNCFVQIRNRTELENLLTKLPRESTAALLAQSALNNPAIKWKS
ncbi:spermatogenesis-defective protein 39 homolog [Galendromus occidentalis]|uniref:Spermatogenesis-defective protein 39 homolog n=1 Tax=Galendromus occidentalis TaxID=34638 RepID=A0AAJ6QNL0_9ACAR|nr:spermatogenesis-defective protein 39 homolog [Galendromus occidentalis]